MQKTTTQKDFMVFLLKTVLSIVILSISFQVSFAQQKASLTKPPSAKKGFPTERPVAAVKAKTNLVAPAKKFGFSTSGPVGPTDVPAINKIYAEKMQKN